LTELDHARSELCPVSVGAVPPIGPLISVGSLVSVAWITIVGSITVIGVVVVSARRSCSYCNGANANRRSAINSTVGISSAINSTAGNASVMHSYTSVMHSYTSASTSKSIARCSRYTCSTEGCSCSKGQDGSVRHSQLLILHRRPHADRACMTQALTYYCPYVSAAYRKGRGAYTKVSEWRSFKGIRLGSEPY
jgi:hypothetical protein